MQVVPRPNKMKVTGVTTPMINQVETWRNKAIANMEAILLDQSILDNDSPLTTITIVKIVVNKLAGTKKEQIATQFCREN